MTALSRRHVLAGAGAAASVAAAALPAVAVAKAAKAPTYRRWPATYGGEGPPPLDLGMDGDLYGYPMSSLSVWDIKRDGVWVRFADYRGMV